MQINDAAVSSTETWSSRKIIDTLCPEFSVSGNPVTCTPVEGYPLGVTVTMEPIQSGAGDPSPDNVRPISGWDEVTVNVRGKNLLGGYNNVWIYIGGTAGDVEGACTSDFIPCQGIDKATISTTEQFYPVPGNAAAIVFYDDNKQLVKRQAFARGNIWTLSVPENAKYIRFTTYNPGNAGVQGEFGSTPTPYEPYQPGTTSTLTLPETIYGGTVNAATGEGLKTWEYIAGYNGETLPGEWISDRDVYAAGATPTIGAQVAYKLAAPKPFQATGWQMIPALSGENTLWTDGDSLTVSGRSDPTAYIQQQISDAITAAVAITGGT